MQKQRIVSLVHEGYLENNIVAFTNVGTFTGIWYAIDLECETIEIEEENRNVIIDYNSIIAIALDKQGE